MKKIFPLLLIYLLLAACVHDTAPVQGPAAFATAQQPSPAQKGLAPAARKRVALVAHDARKPELLAWVEAHAALLAEQELFCTGTTGRLVAERLEKLLPGKSFQLTRFNSGPLGGDQQMGALIAENGLDILIFFIDPMSSHPHTVDIQALLRLSRVYNIVLATTPATADYVLSSPLFREAPTQERPEYSSYINRKTP